jgi:thiol:disulfide interchange protein DsbD
MIQRCLVTAAARWLLLVLALVAPAAHAVSEADLLPVDEAYKLEARAVDRHRVEFTWTIAKGYYLYRHRFAVQPVDSAFKFNPLELPPGHKHHDEFFGDVETYRDSVTAVLTGATASDVDAVTFKVKYQGCADIGICYPPTTRTVTVQMPREGAATGGVDPVADPLAALGGNRGGDLLVTDEALPEEQAFKVEAIANSPAELLLRFTPAKGYYLYRDKTTLKVLDAPGFALGAPRWPAGTKYRDEHFGDVVVYFDQVDVPVPLQRGDAAARTLALEVGLQGCKDKGICYPPMTRHIDVSLPAGEGATLATTAAKVETAPAPAAAPAESSVGFFVAVLLALLGGVILNLMPCVLPVLSFKALALIEGGESHARARSHALWYTLGVLASFAALGLTVLAVRSAGAAQGWGFQLQMPGLVAGLALLMLAIGLSLSGLWQFGAGLANAGGNLASRAGPLGDFFTGVLAVVVASPCTAPFMGSALGYALTAPTVAALAVFLALGFGLALPILAIGLWPRLGAFLPKPGEWMETLKHWLAYPMYLTAAWLAWVFGKQRGVDALALLLVAGVVLAAGLWWWEHRRYASGRGGRWIGALLVLVALGAAWSATRKAEAPVGEPWSPARLAQLRAEHRPVLVNMTADWCITCKVNEKAVFATAAFRELLDETGTVYLVGDWTNEDPAITAFLTEYRSPGVPLYVVFPADGGPGHKLPQLLTTDGVRQELTAAAGK